MSTQRGAHPYHDPPASACGAVGMNPVRHTPAGGHGPSSFPVPGTAAALRVSHADRDAVVEQLKEAYAQGRIDKAEFDARTDLALVAKTRADLEPLLQDLPGGRPPVPGPAPSGHAVDPAGHAIGTGERLWAVTGHLAGVATSFFGPLVLYFLAGPRQPFAQRHLLAAVNFQLALFLVTLVTFGLGGMLYAVAWVLSVVAAVHALAGNTCTYPFLPRILR